MSSSGRPILSRQKQSPDAIAALGDIDPLHARLFAMRGLTEAAQLDYGLARLAPVSRLDNIDEAAELVIANRDRRIVVVGDFAPGDVRIGQHVSTGTGEQQILALFDTPVGPTVADHDFAVEGAGLA
mgnify:CR=1 FL=1